MSLYEQERQPYTPQRIAEAQAMASVQPEPARPSDAFEIAFARFRENDFAPIRAYYGLTPGVQWGPCYCCDQVTFLHPSALRGLTCERCEADLSDQFFTPDMTNDELEQLAMEDPR